MKDDLLIEYKVRGKNIIHKFSYIPMPKNFEYYDELLNRFAILDNVKLHAQAMRIEPKDIEYIKANGETLIHRLS